jgi:CubicO group peptidase (beta-lactamase class C family)
VTGQSLEAFAREALFAPLGISDWEWMKYRNEHVASAVGLRLRPRDAAKIGQLVLNRGEWAGKQIVSAKWIEQSVTPRFQAVGYFGGLFYYGQHWWMGRTFRRQGCEMDCRDGTWRPAHLYRPRTRSCGREHIRALWQRPAGTRGAGYPR